MHVAAQYGVGAVVLGDQVSTVIEQVGHRPAKGRLAQPPFAVVGQGGGVEMCIRDRRYDKRNG